MGPPVRPRTGSFLLEPSAPEDVFTPEMLADEHLAIRRMVDEFWARDVAASLAAIHRREAGVLVSLIRRAAALGLAGISVPEAFGGAELDLRSMMVVEEALARDASFSVTLGGHSGIGTWPIVFFGTDDQKRRYLPRLASAEMIAAYALSEPHAGSDAMAIRTRAQLSADGASYVLNGQKAWITNGGIADLFIVFAKLDGAHFTAFIVERAFDGVSTGVEESKMGLHGSSTTPLFLDNVPVPAANLLGRVGRGHEIAFNVLNLGRLKIGPYVVGAAKEVLRVSLEYARSRVAFGGPIAALPLVRHKLAEMAIRLYATESMAWRVIGLVDATVHARSYTRLDAAREFAAECAMVKVHASEALGVIADEGVQIHGGYGYHRDYFVERAYRDARIYRIFEGTNEINRFVVMKTLLKRASCGDSALIARAVNVARGFTARHATADDPIAAARRVFLAVLGVAVDTRGADLDGDQVVLAALADMAIELLAMESSSLRAATLSSPEGAADMAAVIVSEGLRRVETSALAVVSSLHDVGGSLRQNIRALDAGPAIDGAGLRQRIAERLLAGAAHPA